LGQLQEVQQQLIDLGYQLIFISPDRPEKINELEAKGKFDYTLLSDSKLEAAASFGIAFTLDDGMLAQYKKYGIDLEEASGESHHGLPVPSIWIVDREGTIRFSYVNPDYRVRPHPDIVLAAAKSLR
jgi:peroxiredoxin